MVTSCQQAHLLICCISMARAKGGTPVWAAKWSCALRCLHKSAPSPQSTKCQCRNYTPRTFLHTVQYACTHVCMIMSYTPANKIARPTTHHQRERIKDVSIVAWLQFVLVMLVWCYSSTCTPQLYGILPEQQPSSLCHLRWFGRQFCWVEWWCTSSSAGPSATGTSLSPLCPQLHCTAAEVHRW